MATVLDKPAPLHRERTPARECRTCGAWLSSANEDEWCFQHGGWSTQRLRLEALTERPFTHGTRRAEVGEALEGLFA